MRRVEEARVERLRLGLGLGFGLRLGSDLGSDSGSDSGLGLGSAHLWHHHEPRRVDPRRGKGAHVELGGQPQLVVSGEW